MAQANPQPGSSHALVTATVVFYLVAALAMVMANKWVLTSTDVPVFFLTTQMITASVLFLTAHITRFISLPTPDLAVCKGLIPMVGLNVIGLLLSNFTLKYVDASFYQVARGMVLPFTVLLSTIILAVAPSARASLAIVIVTAGFFIGVFLDGSPTTMRGILTGVVSSAVTALHSVVIKKSLDVVKGSALDLSWYTNALSAIVLLPIVFLAGEVPGIFELFAGVEITATTGMSKLHTFLWGSLITGSLGFLMSIATLLSIKVTSPITHMISSAARGVFASALGVWLFHDIITLGRAASIVTILGGSVYYTWVKHLESLKPAGSTSPKTGKYERLPMEELESGDNKREVS